jgi:two-component system OmpR family sensor kinase
VAQNSLSDCITAEIETPSEDARLLETLEELMEFPGLELQPALRSGATRVATALRCEKVDAFLLDEASQTLRAMGTSDTEMGRLQHALGLDRLALANGGSVVRVFESGTSCLEHHVDRDPEEVRGIVEDLGVRSLLGVPLEVNGVRRGVLSAVSASPEFFQARDLKFLTIVARWIGMLAHRAELAEQSRKVNTEHARRKGADEIITVLAHDLKNHLHPLVVRLHILRLAAEKSGTVSTAQVDAALKSVHRLTRLTEDLLDVKRLDEGLFTLRLESVDLAVLAQETAASIGTSATPVHVRGEPSVVALADEARVRQALENLVANATKYSPPGKPVEVNLAIESCESRPCAVFHVLDSGPGIAPEVASTLFERFSLSSDSKGLGLGLYLSYRIARVHSGDLSVHTRPSGGTCFRFTLPLEPPELEPSSGR